MFNALVVVGICFAPSPHSSLLIFLLTSALVLTVHLTLCVQTEVVISLLVLPESSGHGHAMFSLK